MKLKNENKIDVTFVVLIMAITSVLSIFIACATVASREYEKSHDEIDEIKESKTEFMFERVGFGTRVSEEIVYDKKTKVMYINDSSGRYSVIVNPDGTPRLYTED